MKKVKPFTKVMLWFAITIVFCSLYIFYKMNYPKSDLVGIFNFFTLLSGLFLLYYLFKYLLTNKFSAVLQAAKKGIMKLFSILYGKVKKVLPKSKKKIYIKGMTDEKTYIHHAEQQQENKQRHTKKRVRWKDLNSNSERIRFLYRKFLHKAMKHGFQYKEAQTPYEIEKELTKKQIDAAMLTSIYVDSRYTQKDISDEEVTCSSLFVSKSFSKN